MLLELERLAGLGTWHMDVATGALHWSDVMFEIFGVDRANGAPSHEGFADLLSIESYAAADVAVRQALMDGSPFEVELETIRPGGARGWLVCRGEAVRGAGGHITALRGTALDITERKRAQLALREGEERLRQILEHSAQVFYSHTCEHRFTYTSPQFMQFLGYSAAEAPEQWTEYLTDNPANAIGMERTTRAITTGTAQPPYELELQPKGREPIWVEVHESPVVVHGSTVAVVGALTNVTERRRAEEALRASEAEFRTLAETMPQIVWIAGADGSLIHFNQHWMNYTGLTLDESLGHDGWLPPIHPGDRLRAAMVWKRAIDGGEPYEIEYRVRRADGIYHWMLGRALPLRDDARGVVKWFGTCTDIDELKRAHKRLDDRANQQLLVAALGQTALAGTDLGNVFAEAVAAVAAGLGVEFANVMLFDDAGALCVQAGAAWSPHGAGGIDVPIGAPNKLLGVLGAYARRPRDFSNDDLVFLQSLANTLSSAIERSRAEQRLAHRVHHDALTELPNRLLLTDRLNVALAGASRTGSRLALMFMDIDRFKSVNDVFGHQMGDDVLREASARLRACVRASDTVSRQGGDEFVIVLPQIDHERVAARVAQKLMDAFAAPFTLAGTEIVLSASIGIAFFPDNGADAEALLRNADVAMYVAKKNGRNRYQFYSADMNARALERLVLEGDLRRAIEQEQLFVVYQPQIDLRTGAVVGAEALLRWQHPTHGDVPPAQFIPIAEECGLIVAIGTWVLEAACRQHAEWTADGLVVGSIAVNVSAHQFRQPGFVDVVASVLARTGLPPELLELEVTESAIMHDLTDVLRKLEDLRAIGVRLAIDDFGTGYSSLNHLKQFPIQRLKIDRSFVRGLPDDRESAAIVRAIISLGQSLGLNVLAEGIEDAGHEACLSALGCDAAQGYLYAHPMRVDAFRRYLAYHQRSARAAVASAHRQMAARSCRTSSGGA